MKVKRSWLVALATGVWGVGSAQADRPACESLISRQNVVSCALAGSALVRAQRENVAAVQGRQQSVSAWLPSNPTLSFSGDRRTSRQQDATNWYGTLSQELEIAGQRRARRAAVASEQRAQASATDETQRSVAANALRAYFEVLAARDALDIARELERSFAAANAAARAAAEHGLSAGLDADLAELSSTRLAQARIEAQRAYDSALAELAALLGQDPAAGALRVEGELTPLTQVDAELAELANLALERRPELAAAEATRASFAGWAEAYRRARVPNLTVSVFAQRDGFDERVLGAGVSIPVTLPAPMGRSYAGEVAEQVALARRASSLLEHARRDVRLEVTQAFQAWQAASATLALYTPERLARAQQSLDAIARELAAGRLPVSSMIVPQQALIGFLQEHVAAELATCLASVELARSAGLAFEGEAP